MIDLKRCLANEQAAEPTTRAIRMADGTTYLHQVGPLSWIDMARYAALPVVEEVAA